MKVFNDNPLRGLSIYEKKVKQAKATVENPKSVPSDNVELSSVFKELSKFTKEVPALDYVQEEKVAELRDKIKSGKYEVEIDGLAEKMIKDFSSKIKS